MSFDKDRDPRLEAFGGLIFVALVAAAIVALIAYANR